MNGIHDVSDGGLACALAEMAFGGDTGFSVDLDFDGCTIAEACFAESASRFVVSVDPTQLEPLLTRAHHAGVLAAVLGTAGGDRLVVTGAFDIALADATRAWRDALPRLLGAR